MDPESVSGSGESRLKWYKTTLCLAYQSLGVVYGDLSTSPIYVYTSTFSGRLSLHEEDDEILGVLSLVFWTLTLIPLFKYIIFVLGADDNGEGGTFALYSLLCRRAKLGLLTASCVPDDDSCAQDPGPSVEDTRTSSLLKEFFDKHQSSRILLLLAVLLGTSMVIGDGILTPSMSVLSAVYGIKVKAASLHENYTVLIASAILVGLFALQHVGTHKVGFLFAPILLAWLLCISGVGMYNIVHWNPDIVNALSPYYAYKFFQKTGKDGWTSLGGIVLCVTGAEAMFADLGHFSHLSIRIAFTAVVYPCLILAYMGEAAYLSKHKQDLQRSFYKAIPGLAVITVMFVTTCLMFLIIIMVWKRNVLAAVAFVVVFGSVEFLYFSACIAKVHNGAWLPLVFSLVLMSVMGIWYYGTLKKHSYEIHNRVSLETLLRLGLNNGVNRIPGIVLIYSNVVTGVPPMFAHFVTNFPTFHQILMFVTIQTLTVPNVLPHQRYLISRIGPPEFRIYRCIVRLGYKDARQDAHSFESNLIDSLVNILSCPGDDFIDGEETTVDQLQQSNPVVDGITVRHENGNGLNRRTVRFRGGINIEELKDLARAREAGVAYMMGNVGVVASDASSYWKKFVIDIVYGFLRQNCRRPSTALGVPHTSLIEVGMVYRV
ncbi:hypothetical protein HS088_TW01G00742 [Tripterygium wilfordii]|uniref:Potassium transporter n=1 Tax=Tripterygium wilfordii TaxID=458696 RepID=A0A7J7E2Y8_TRIWF|nr:hypothetical protein HS088_TW01G00742 [Tripterygium wilfordii]